MSFIENSPYRKQIKLRIENLSLIFLLLLTGCVQYSFSGGNTGSAKTITIRTFFNNAGGGPANLGQVFSEKLRDYYQQNSKLSIVKDNGDWILNGSIIGYTVTPMAPTGTGTAALNRLTITIAVEFTNTKEGPGEIKSFQSDFSFYDDFSQSESLSAVESRLIENILSRIVFDIFSKTTSNW